MALRSSHIKIKSAPSIGRLGVQIFQSLNTSGSPAEHGFAILAAWHGETVGEGVVKLGM